MHRGNEVHIPRRTAEEIAESRIGPIRFARSLRDRDRPKKKLSLGGSAHHAIIWGVLLAIFLAVRVLVVLADLRVHELIEAAVSLALGLIVAVAVYKRFAESHEYPGFRWRGMHQDLASDDDRLVVLGNIARVCTVGPLEDLPFEPRLFNVSHLFRGSMRRRISTWIVGLGFFLALYWTMYTTIGIPSISGQILGYATLAFIIVADGWVFPVYLRIVPGRLDILRFRFLGSKAYKTESFDLTKARVIVDADKEVVGVTEDDREVNITYETIWHKRFVPYYILLAAISTHTPGPLPADQLLELR